MRGKTEEKEAQETAFTARDAQPKTKSAKPKNRACSNCAYTNHSVESCFRPGGPMHKSKQKEQERGKEGKRKLDKANVARDKSLSDSDESTYEVAAVFAHCEILPDGSGTFDDSDYLMVAHMDPLKEAKYDKCNVAWTEANTKPISLTTIKIAPLNPEECAALTTGGENNLYHIDSGATSHCSPHHADFLELVPIKPQAI